MTFTLSCAIIDLVPEVDFTTIFVTAIGLSADCFAVALGISITQRELSWRRFIRFPVAFGLFQALMLIFGWLAGRSVVEYIAACDHWLAFVLLAIIGGRMIWESFHEKEEGKRERDINRWFTLFALAVATSIDSLAAGLSYAFLHVDILIAGITTGIIAFIITFTGYFIGNRVGSLVGKWAEVAGGVILILIGLRILLEHLL
jgi:putative Mn2+ efflux pump MntP